MTTEKSAEFITRAEDARLCDFDFADDNYGQ